MSVETNLRELYGGVSFSQNPDILKFNGNTGTAIPEAHLILLSAISTILLLTQRRRW